MQVIAPALIEEVEGILVVSDLCTSIAVTAGAFWCLDLGSVVGTCPRGFFIISTFVLDE